MPARPHLLIVEAPYYQDIVEALVQGAVAALGADGASYERITVPGALEIPAAIQAAATQDQFDGFVALGCVIRGETSHYDYVCAESAHGLQLLMLQRGLAIGNGILTVENREQAEARADIKRKNKGGEAARAALALLHIQRRFAP